MVKHSSQPKRKIGLFLGARPIDGGLFQYSQAVLKAVSELSESECEAVVCYQHKEWEPLLAAAKVDSFSVPQDFYSRALRGIWKRLGLSLSVWRAIAPNVHGLTKALLSKECDLWLFPAQDEWTYYFPVRSIGFVHDLMHRYERRFLEVSADGEFERRERHYRALCKYSCAIITDSELGRRHVEESYHVASEKVFSLPYIPPSYIYAKNFDASFDQRYKLPVKYIFYPAQFWEHKNHAALVRAVFALCREAPDLKLVFAGSKKNAYPMIQSLIVELGVQDQIIFLGYVPEGDIPELYRRAQAMIMPTFFGPTNIPPLEAFALGCPVAISNIYGMPEQVGEAALLFDPHSDKDIESALHRLWTDEALLKKLKAKGFLRAEAWTQRHFTSRLAEVLGGVPREDVRKT